jgi:hypothetical protein
MTEADHDPYAPIKDAWHLYQTMTEDLAGQYAHDVFAQRPVSDTWGDLPGKIDTTKNALYELAGPSGTFKERRHSRHERNEIAGVNEALDETHASLVKLGDAELDYLQLEQRTKDAMAQGGKGDLESLDMARSQVSRAQETLRQYRANLALRLENLADDTGSGLFTPN